MPRLGGFLYGLGQGLDIPGAMKARRETEYQQSSMLLNIIQAGGIINPSKELLDAGDYQMLKWGQHKVAFPTQDLSKVLDQLRVEKMALEGAEKVQELRTRGIMGRGVGAPGYGPPLIGETEEFLQRPLDLPELPEGFGAGVKGEEWGRTPVPPPYRPRVEADIKRRLEEIGVTPEFPGMKAKKPLSYGELESRAGLEMMYMDQIKARAREVLTSEGYDSSEESVSAFLGDPTNKEMILNEILGR